MYGRFIRCDVCEDPKNDFSINLPWGSDHRTLEAAQKAGWLILEDDHVNNIEGTHSCPECLKEKWTRK